MARPVRAAARRARELMASGVGKRALETDDLPGMSSGEEDEIDEIVCEEFLDEGVEESGNLRDARKRSTVRTKTYGDDDNEPKIPPFKPERPVGPQLADRVTRHGMKNYVRAIDFFQLFFTHEIIQMLTENTNLYGWMTIFDKPSYATPQGTWEEVTTTEMWSFIGLICFMGFVRMHDTSRYWHQATLYSGGWAPRFLSGYRYKCIASMLHASNPSTENPADRLTKIRPVLDHVKQMCSSLYQPRQQVSVDERMVRSKARSGLLQFIPNKPTRFGFKLWCFCQASNGYTVDFNVYTGRRQRPSKQGLGYDIVMELLKGHLGQGYQVFFDNFFTSLPLIKSLMGHGTSACGTTVVTRRGFPTELRDKAWATKANRGDTQFIRTDKILCQQWKDNRAVCVCSSMHSGSTFVYVRRHSKNPDGSHRRIMIRRPTAIHDYNSNMGGVDLSDQRLESYSMLHKTQKWWKTIFYHLLDMCILNSFLLFDEWRQMHPEVPELQRPPGYSHLHFREELCRQLARISDFKQLPPVITKPRMKSSFGFEGVHMPRLGDARRNCRVCYILLGKENKTKWFCSEEVCNVPVCMCKERNCFVLWHTDTFQQLRMRVGK